MTRSEFQEALDQAIIASRFGDASGPTADEASLTPLPASVTIRIVMFNIPPGSHGIVYVRVSTAHQADDELPVDSQIAELTSAVASAGATCDVVKELGISGTGPMSFARRRSSRAKGSRRAGGLLWATGENS